jgi:hypothetical protein
MIVVRAEATRKRTSRREIGEISIRMTPPNIFGDDPEIEANRATERSQAGRF